MNSLDDKVKANTTTATIPGKAKGRRVRTNAAARLNPSTMACSSISRGIDLKKPMSSQTETGMVIVGYRTTRAHSESWRCRNATTRESEMKRRDGGIRYTKKIATPMAPPQRRFMRAREY